MKKEIAERLVRALGELGCDGQLYLDYSSPYTNTQSTTGIIVERGSPVIVAAAYLIGLEDGEPIGECEGPYDADDYLTASSYIQECLCNLRVDIKGTDMVYY